MIPICSKSPFLVALTTPQMSNLLKGIWALSKRRTTKTGAIRHALVVVYTVDAIGMVLVGGRSLGSSRSTDSVAFQPPLSGF